MLDSQVQSSPANADRSEALPIPPEWRVVAPWYGLLATLRILGGFWLIVIATPWAVLYGSPWALVILAPLLGIMAYQLSILIHDCSHKTLFRNPESNRIIGEISSGILATDFRQFTRIHWLHHQNLGAIEDPQRPDYVNLREATPGGILWHLFRPLIGYNMFFKLIQYNIGKMIRSSGGRIAEGERTRPHILPIIVAQTMIVVLITGFGKVWWLFFFYPACAGAIGLFLSQTRGFVEHIAPAGAASEVFVRTHLPNLVDRAIFYPLYFNYHLEHHLRPSIPSCYLPQFHQLVRPTHHTADTLSSGTLATIRKRLQQARRYHAPKVATACAGNAD